MAKTTTKKPKNPMAALLGGSFAAPPPPSPMGFLGAPPPAPLNLPGQTPSLQKMRGMGMGVSPEMEQGMTAARSQGLLREKLQEGPGPMPGMPPPPAAGPPAPGLASMMPPMPMAPTGALTPNAKAIIDAMTGKRVHKGMGGQQLGMEGVDPALKYMLYAQRGRRHIGFGGKEIY